MRIRGAMVLVLFLHMACVLPNATAQRGDAAAARGDWKDAERAYRDAVSSDPGNAELSRKYQEARTNAIAVAMRTAEACRVRSDLACVDSELEYVLELDPGNVEAATMQKTARQDQARAELAEAERLLGSGNPVDALAHVDRARGLTSDTEVATDAGDLERRATDLAAEQAKQLLASTGGKAIAAAVATLDQALALARVASQRDAGYASLEQQIADERGVLAEKEAKRLVAEGDAALLAEDYGLAASSFDRAATFTSDPSVIRRATYARSIAAGDDEVAQRDFENAAARFQAAIDTGEDHGVALLRLNRVAPRTYRIRLDAIGITPNRPGTTDPWVGDSWIRQVAYQGVGAVLGGFVGGPSGVKLGQELGKVAASVPPENRPTLRVRLELPDGRSYQSKSGKGIYVAFDAEFYVRSNYYDSRTVLIVVEHVRKVSANEDVAAFRVPLGELVSQQVQTDLTSSAPAIQAVAFNSEVADDYLDGAVSNLATLDTENASSSRSSPKRDRRRYQITGMQVVVTNEDNGGDLASEPDPQVLISQAGDEVFHSQPANDTRTANWELATTYLFVADDEQLDVVVRDLDPYENDVVFSATITGADLASGSATLTTKGGSSITILAVRPTNGPR